MNEDELVANLFRINQTKQKLLKDNVQGEKKAKDVHYEVGKKVRKAIADIGGMMPDEDRKAAIEAVPKYLKWYENEKKRNQKLTKIYPRNFLLDRRFMDDFTIEEVTQTNTNNYGSNNRQQDGRTQQQINIERNAQAVARMFSEIQPMQSDGGDN